MQICRERRANHRHLPKRSRIDVDAGSGDVLRRQFPADLHDMPSGFRPWPTRNAAITPFNEQPKAVTRGISASPFATRNPWTPSVT